MSEAEMESEEPKGPAPAGPWLDRIKDYQTAFQKWADQCRNLDKLYSRRERSDAADREYAIFWANIEVLKPAVYARPPVPVVVPRFKDNNAVALAASEVLERASVVNFEQQDLNGVMQEVRNDFLMYARGTAWARLADINGSQAVAYDHVAACDFAHEMLRSWRIVGWVARRAWLSREEGVKRFDEAFNSVPLKKQDENAAVPQKTDKAAVWEIWDKASGKVIWVAEDHSDVLDEQDAFLSLAGFFPCPPPAYGTLIPGGLIPVPEILQYKDQIEEINEYTARIAALSQSLRMKGFYAAGQGDISEAIETAIKSIDDRATMIPISSMAALGPGGFKDSIVWFPVGDVITLITSLVELRRVVIEDVYQITGISDIVRGSTDAGETATAQQIKSQWGSLRIRERQNELVRFARDMTRITAEIMAENFAPETLAAMSQTDLPTQAQKQQAQMAVQQAQALAQQAQAMQQQGQQVPPPPEPPKDAVAALKKPSLEEVMAFLRDDKARGFTIEIETDSTIQPDEDAEKQRRVEFVTAVGGLFQQAAPIVMQAPQLGPFMGAVLKFAADGFRAGRPLGGAIDNLTEMLEGMAEKAQQPSQPDPAMEIELEGKKADTEGKKANAAKATVDLETAKIGLQTAMNPPVEPMAPPAPPPPDPDAEDERELRMARGKKEIDFEFDTKRKRLERDNASGAEMGLGEGAAEPSELGPSPLETLTGALSQQGEMLGALAEQNQAILAGLGEIGAGMQSLIQHQTTPKRVVRGPDGRVSGIELAQ